MNEKTPRPGGTGQRGGTCKGALSKSIRSPLHQQSDPLSEFSAAIASFGLGFPAITPDGQIHRFHVDGDKPHQKNGWYSITLAEGRPHGAFGCHKRSVHETWTGGPTPARSRPARVRARERQERKIEADEKHKDARNRIAWIWSRAWPVTTHGYLDKKRVAIPDGLAIRQYKETLVVPLLDSSGTFQSQQFIDRFGNKWFLRGGRISGCFFPIGQTTDRVFICEGVATGLTIHNVTGDAVAVAFNCGNLRAVAEVLRQKFPDAEIVIAADNDTSTEGNPGLTNAKAAATAVNGRYVIPEGLAT